MNAPARVLIVDDDADYAASIRDLFEAYGYEVATAGDGASGLQRAREMRPDVMILDVMMATDYEGFEVARRIPECPELRDTAVLLVTGVAQALNLKNKLEPDQTWLPVDRVLEKPIDPAQLLSEVEKAIARKKGGKT